MPPEETPSRPDVAGARRQAVAWGAFWILVAPGLGAMGGSAFGPLRARWYVVGVAAVALGALTIAWATLPTERTKRAVAVGLTLALGVLAVGLPWSTDDSHEIRTWEDTATQRSGDAVFLLPENLGRSVEVVRPRTGRIVTLHGATADDDARYAAGSDWLVRSVPRGSASGTTLEAYDGDGERLWSKDFPPQRFGNRRESPDLLAATPRELIVWHCPDDSERTRSRPACTMTAVDRAGEQTWRRTVGQGRNGSGYPQHTVDWRGERGIPSALWISDGDDRLQQLAPGTGQPVQTLRSTRWQNLTARGLLVADAVSVAHGDSTCRLRLMGPVNAGGAGPTRWTTRATGDICQARPNIRSGARYALAGNSVIDLRSGATRAFTSSDAYPAGLPDSANLGGDLVQRTAQTQDNGYHSRAWVTVPRSGRTLWSLSGESIQASTSTSSTVVTREATSINPFRPRMDGQSDPRAVREVLVAGTGSTHPQTCTVPSPSSAPIPIGADRVIARTDDGRTVLLRCG